MPAAKLPFASVLLTATAALAVSALTLGAPAFGQTIGTVASQEPTLRGTPPGAGARTLSIGTAVIANETITSSASGRGQILFADQTTLSLAPNTTIVLDQFVFNPNGSGSLGLSMTQGALRFIGGSLSRGQEATVTTPTATIGIRGSSAIITIINGETYTVFLAGERLCLTTTAGNRSCTSRRGGVLTQAGYQGRVNPAFLADLLDALDGTPPPTATGGGGTGLGSGVDNPNPSGRGPVSTTGEEFDQELAEDNFTGDTRANDLPNAPQQDAEPEPEPEPAIVPPPPAPAAPVAPAPPNAPPPPSPPAPPPANAPTGGGGTGPGLEE